MSGFFCRGRVESGGEVESVGGVESGWGVLQITGCFSLSVN